jgi:hypothetical protein
MTKILVQLLSEAKELLLACGLPHRAKWFSDFQVSLNDASIAKEELCGMLSNLDSILGGMGSFADIPLTPSVDNLTVQQARTLQWELVEKIGKEITKLKNKLGCQNNSSS